MQLSRNVASTRVRVGSAALPGCRFRARPRLKFLRWWHREHQPNPFTEQLEGYLAWMRDERGLSLTAVDSRAGALALLAPEERAAGPFRR